MMSFNPVSVLSYAKYRSCLPSFFITTSLIGGIYFLGSAFLAKDFKIIRRSEGEISVARQDVQSNTCKNRCRPFGSEALPEGIVVETSNLEMRPLWGHVPKKRKRPENLLAIAVGIKQKEVVNRMVEKFMGNGFDVMLFHYDGLVDEWSDLRWNGTVIHVSAMNQTKWYLAIVREEGLEISQPALDPAKSEVHHQITVRRRRSRLHRRYYKTRGGRRCDDNSTGPPCVGWVEMMAPVFSRAAWRCAWYMIQNDLIHAWGLDMQLGYCAQGDRATNVGVVDSEYIVHFGLPTLGALEGTKLNDTETPDNSLTKHMSDSEPLASSRLYKVDNRLAVRWQSFKEMRIFGRRWDNAVKEDKCFVDPYGQPSGQKSH